MYANQSQEAHKNLVIQFLCHNFSIRVFAFVIGHSEDGCVFEEALSILIFLKVAKW